MVSVEMNILIINVLQIKKNVLKMFLNIINKTHNLVTMVIHNIKEDHQNKVGILLRKL